MWKKSHEVYCVQYDEKDALKAQFEELKKRPKGEFYFEAVYKWLEENKGYTDRNMAGLYLLEAVACGAIQAFAISLTSYGTVPLKQELFETHLFMFSRESLEDYATFHEQNGRIHGMSRELIMECGIVYDPTKNRASHVLPSFDGTQIRRYDWPTQPVSQTPDSPSEQGR